MRRIAYASALTLIASSALAEQQTPIDIADVPESIRLVAEETAPGVEFHTVSIENEGGVNIYEFEAADHNGKHIEIDVDENGRLEEIEMEIDFDDVPGAVRESLTEKAPGFKPDYIEFSVRDGDFYVYEFEGNYSGGKVEMEIAEDGSLLLMIDNATS